MEANRVVWVEKTSIMEALKKKKSQGSLDVVSSQNRLQFFEASNMTKKRREARE